ncbi:MAG: S46 family peptidase [Flavobacteriales bacterium]|jgi:hypothetical protein|nr:S46 family peptidase [Flavobacteriales bacterium]
MRIIGLVLSVFIVNLTVLAHEGMWIPSLLKALEDDMQAKGLKLSAEDIYSINHSSLKDAIVHFGGGCTAEVVSNQGLILTNHHCGYYNIQQHSSLENDYLKDGFWAMSKSEELINKGLTATFIERIEDVTAKLNIGVTTNMDVTQANIIRQRNGQELLKNAVKGTNYDAVIKPFFYGNEFYMIVTKTFKDVRLVGAPPSAIGKFGGDTDNWVWPRHTGDFSVFRIYANRSNEPAEPSVENIPYSPKKWLPVSMEGVQKDDFTMVFGFPGVTEQYLSSKAVEDYINVINPARIEMRKQSLSVIDAAMAASDATRIKYAAKQSRISNAYKKWIGQNLGLKKKDVLEQKRSFEKEYLERVPKNGDEKDILYRLIKQDEKMLPLKKANSLFVEMYYYGPEIIRYADGFYKLFDKPTPPGKYTKDEKKQREIENQKIYDATLAKKKAGLKGYFKNYDVVVDKAIFKKLVPLYIAYADQDLLPEVLKKMAMKFKTKNGQLDVEAYADYLYQKSVLTSESKVNKLLSGSKKKIRKTILKDPAYILAQSIIESREKTKPAYKRESMILDDLMRQFLAAQMKHFPEVKFWADANSTLRLTYGKIEGTAPRDGMEYTWFTTMDGIIEKNNTGNKDFEIPAKMREMWNSKDYGPYATDGDLRICLLGSNHTTGGNSGSPALNAEGHLIGINFDRSWESTMSDIKFDGEICRNIMVDIKYVLWVMDKYAGATHLVKEMELVDKNWRINNQAKLNKKTIQQTTRQLRENPSDEEALLKRAKAYFDLGMEAEGLNDLNAILVKNKKSIAALNERGRYFTNKGELSKALKDINASLKLNKLSNLDANFIKGTILASKNEYKEAIEYFNKAIAIDYSHYKSYYNRGVCQQELGNTEEACRNFKLAKLMGGKAAENMHSINCSFGGW